MGNDYINNHAFQQAIERYKYTRDNRETESEDFKQAQADLTAYLYLLADNILRAFKFKLIDPDDALQEGVMICIQKIDCFDIKKGRAFVYFTSVILNSYRMLYRNASGFNELKKKYNHHLSGRSGQRVTGGRSKEASPQKSLDDLERNF